MAQASGTRLAPATVKRLRDEAVEIVWHDGHRSVYLNRYLRDNCPCAACRESHAPRGQQPRVQLPVVGGPPLYPVQIGVVGRYALSIQWSDRHDTGIYSYETLRQLCPCEGCQCAPPDGVTAPASSS